MRTGLGWLACAWLMMSSAQAQGVVEFVQEGCGPCRRMAPIVERLERAGVRIRHHDATASDPVCRTLGIQTTPTFIAVDRHGREVERIVGPTSEARLRALAERASAVK